MKVKTYKAPPMLAAYPDLLTPADLAEITGQHVDTIRALMNRGDLPSVRIGQRLYTPKTSFLDLLGVRCDD